MASIIAKWGHILQFLCGSVLMSTSTWSFCQWSQVSIHSPLDSVILGCPQISHQLTTVSSLDNFWWILIRNRLGVPTKDSVLATLWSSHPAIAAWSKLTDSCTFFWHLISQNWGQNNIISDKEIIYITHHLSILIIFCLINAIAAYKSKCITFLFHINEDWLHPTLTQTHFDASYMPF